MAEHQLPKLRIRVRFPSPALNLLAAVFLVGCTAYVEPPRIDAPGGAAIPSVRAPMPPAHSSAMQHRVSRGETLWSIARSYGVDLHDLVRANRISDASQIEVGQMLVIPNSRRSRSSTRVRSSGTAAVPMAGESFVWPLEGKVISLFGMRRRGNVNKGIDIQAPVGSEIFASRSGRVSFVHEALPGFGKTIILDHGDGYATVYAYLSQILVRDEQAVSQWQVIARAGDTGRTEVSALHFEIRHRQKPKNPFYYLP